MTIRLRGDIAQLGDTMRLRAAFRDGTGTLIDLDSFPTISIVEPGGSVSLAASSAGITRVSLGLYEFDYALGMDPAVGVYRDVWSGTYNGFTLQAQFNFVVDNTELPGGNPDGLAALGDDPGFNYSQTAIMNINKILKSLRARLKSSGKAVRTDAFGNKEYVSCDIFSVDLLTTFIGTAISDFNQTPYFTGFTFEDTQFIDQFLEILVEGAATYALGSQALIERGREFSITDNGITFNPPTVSELLNTQYAAVLSNYWEKLKMIKNSMRPGPKGLGTLTISTSRNPFISRLRHRRANVIL
jgi:hypothetical protein